MFYPQMCLRCVQMFSDVQRCFQVFTDVLGCWMEILFLMIFDSLKVLSNESMDFNDPKEFNDPQVFDDPKEISIGSMKFSNPKVYSDTSFFIGLVFFHD